MVTCESCKRPEDAVNHVPGHVFVGWGCGWQLCPKCLGSQLMPTDEEVLQMEDSVSTIRENVGALAQEFSSKEAASRFVMKLIASLEKEYELK